MNSERISWFWPLSFLAALGQLLLLVTDNEAGPAAARFALAAWTFWLPGVWLGNLLTKPHTGLPARLALQATCAMAVAYLLLMLRATGLVPLRALPVMIAAGAVVIGLAFLLLPGNRGGLRRAARWEARETRHADPQVMAIFALVLVAVAVLGLAAGSPLGLRPDGVDWVGAARLAGRIPSGIAAPAWHEGLGTAGTDAHRSLAPALLDLLARLSNLPADRVWDLLPAVGGPLLLLAVFLLGRVVFRNENLGVAAALVYLLLATAGLSGDALRLVSYPDRLAQIPYFVGIAVFIDGLDRPSPRAAPALGLAALAVLATHLGMGLMLMVTLLAVGTFTWGSVDRFLEGVPLLVVLWIPVVVLGGLYLGFRIAALGSVDPFTVPAQGLLVLGPGRWMLDPGAFAGAVLAAAILAVIGLAALFREGAGRIGIWYLVVTTLLAVVLGFDPWLTPFVAKLLGGTVHLLPRLAPVALVLVAVAVWAVRGLAQSEGPIWLRGLYLVTLAVVGVWLVGTGVSRFAYAPGRLAAERARPPESLRPLAEAADTVLAAGTRVVGDPVTVGALAAYADLRSVYVPARPERPWGDSFRRVLAARQALMLRGNGDGPGFGAAEGDTAGGDGGPDSLVAWRRRDPVSAARRDALARFLRADPAGAVVAASPDLAPRGRFDAWDLTGGEPKVWARWLGEESVTYRPVALDSVGTAWRVNPPLNGPGPAVWLSARTGPPRPPASVRFPGPAFAGLRADSSVAVGDTLTVATTWFPPENAESLDPRGYRVRVELRAVPPAPPSWRLKARRAWRGLADALSGRRHAEGVETPLAGGRPVAWWSGSQTETVRMPVPRWLVPGMYEVRTAALPGPVSFDRPRRGLSFLPPMEETRLVRVTGRAG